MTEKPYRYLFTWTATHERGQYWGHVNLDMATPFTSDDLAGTVEYIRKYNDLPGTPVIVNVHTYADSKPHD